MGRKHSNFEFFVDAASLIPWWVNISLALGSYVVMHYIATLQAPIVKSGAEFSLKIWQIGMISFSTALQYILPAIILTGAVVSAIKRKHRDHLVTQTKDGATSAVLNNMSWREFEALVGEAFRRIGYSVTENTDGGPDGGVDLVLKKNSELFLVQCKQWRSYIVNVNTIRELYGVMASRGAAGGFVVTSGRFTSAAIEFASGKNIELVDGIALHGMIRDMPSPARSVDNPQSATVATQASVPFCPVCKTPMVKRTSKRSNSLNPGFWGYPQFPKCRGTRKVV